MKKRHGDIQHPQQSALQSQKLLRAQARTQASKWYGLPSVQALPILGFLAQVDRPQALLTQTEAVLIGAGLTGAIALILLFMLSRAIRTLERGAKRLASGDLSQRVAVNGPLLLSSMAESLNEMAKQLQHRLSTVDEQRNELSAVLSSMSEGVLAIDQDQRLLSLNPAAAEMFKVDAAHAIGRSIQEVVRNSGLQAFVDQTLSQHSSVQAEFPLQVDNSPYARERFIEAQGAALRSVRGKRIGAVLVFHDVTRLRKLESIRTDFVSNVSHEIKTPVTAIKGAVETLLDEDPQRFGPDALKFLQIISRQSDRMEAIIEDLLSLTRLEHDNDRFSAELSPYDVSKTIAAAVETCQATAKDRKTSIEIKCAGPLLAQVIPPLLEQAMVNLIVNAIKYSPEHSHVLVSAAEVDNEVVISVEDHGRGIEPEHLPRVFERFYRTDKARSRDMGGTGLGLSIVKHVADAHRGRASVHSVAGVGSTFRIHLQLPRSAEKTNYSTSL